MNMHIISQRVFCLQWDWSWPGTGQCPDPVWVEAPSGGFDRFLPVLESSLRRAPHHAGPGPPERARTFGIHPLPQRNPETWVERRSRCKWGWLLVWKVRSDVGHVRCVHTCRPAGRGCSCCWGCGSSVPVTIWGFLPLTAYSFPN